MTDGTARRPGGYSMNRRFLTSLMFCVAGGSLIASGLSAMIGTTPTISLLMVGLAIAAAGMMYE